MLPNAKSCQPIQVNLYRSLVPQYIVGNKILFSIKNIHIKNVLLKIKPLWIGPLTIQLANYNYNNYSLNLFTYLSFNLIYNTFHVPIITPYVNNYFFLFPHYLLT